MVREVHYSLDETFSSDETLERSSYKIWEGRVNELMADWDDDFFDDPILPLLLVDESLAERLADREAQVKPVREHQPKPAARHLAGADGLDCYWPTPRQNHPKNSSAGKSAAPRSATSSRVHKSPPKNEAKPARQPRPTAKAHIDPPAA